MRSSPWGWSFRNTCDVLSTAVRKTPFKSSSWARNSSSNSRKCLVLWGHTNTGTFSRTLATMGFWNILNYRWFLNEGFDIYEKIYIFFHNHLQFDLGLLYFPNKISFFFVSGVSLNAWLLFYCRISSQLSRSHLTEKEKLEQVDLDVKCLQLLRGLIHNEIVKLPNEWETESSSHRR